MAEKKKTVTKKTSTSKKAKVVAGKKIKKVSSKPTATKKKIATKTIKSVKKAAPKKTSTKSKTKAVAKSAFSYMNWENVFKGSFRAFPSIWWRVGIINIITLALVLIAGVFSFGVFFLAIGGSGNFENLLANLNLGGTVASSDWLVSGVALFIFINLVIIIGILGKIASFLVVKNYVKKTQKNPLSIYFKDAWAYFWNYLWIGFLVLWYLVWPLLIVFLLALIAVIVISVSGFAIGDFLMAVLMVMGVMGIVVFMIYRGINVMFYQGVLIESGLPASKSFKKSLALVKGNWWKVFFGIFVFFMIASAAQMIINIPGILSDIGLVPEYIAIVSALLDFSFSFFILAPISVSFIYFMMLQVSKNKGIKL